MASQRFNSKVSYGLLLPVTILILAIPIIAMWSKAPGNTVIVLSILTIGTLSFVWHIFLTTNYEIGSDQRLYIKSGFLYRKNLSIANIRTISKSTTLLASPAASLDRLELAFGEFDSITVSPDNKQLFIDSLLKINPNIKVK